MFNICCLTKDGRIRSLFAKSCSCGGTAMASADFSAPFPLPCHPGSLIIRQLQRPPRVRRDSFPRSRRIYLYRFGVVIGLLCTWPDYPVVPSLYPVSVRRLRVLPPTSFRPHLAATPLSSANSSDHYGLWRTCTS